MITCNFEYYRPTSIDQAVRLFQHLDQTGKKPIYYGGGTEIISMGRMDNISTGSVIDIKEIPECRLLEIRGSHLVIGAGITLTQIHESNNFPLLAQAGARVADHTMQNKITLGGNLCSTIVYREAVLPLLLTDAEIIVAGPRGTRALPINQVFDQCMNLDKGEFIVQVKVQKPFLSYPYVHVKRTRQDKIHYPLVTICALRADKEIRAAFSNVCPFPFRSRAMEKELNRSSEPVGRRVDKAINLAPAGLPNDLESSSAYRRFVLKNLLTSIVTELEG